MRIGIDLGGTKIAGVALDPQGGVLAERRIPTPASDYRAVVRAIADLVARLEEETGQRGTVGIGHPGTISPATGLIKNANSVVLNGKPLDLDLEQALGRPVRMANDANCFALSESVDGAGAGAGTVFGVILGTGVGGGVVVDGRLLVGPNAIAGEWGHNPLPWPRAGELPGQPCYCGMQGCIETFLSGPGMEGEFARETGRNVSTYRLAELAAAGDTEARAAVDRFVDRVARALASVINMLDPDVVVLGGGMSNFEALYQDVPELWGAYVFSDRVDTRLERNHFGDASGVRGAAWLWP